MNHIDKIKEMLVANMEVLEELRTKGVDKVSTELDQTAIVINDYIESLKPIPIHKLEKPLLMLHQEIASGQAGVVPFKIIQGINPPDFVAEIGSKKYLLRFSDIAALLINNYMAEMKAEAKARDDKQKPLL